MKTPQRLEVWLVDLGLAAKVRPAVVMSIPATDVDRALVTIVLVTRAAIEQRRDGYPRVTQGRSVFS